MTSLANSPTASTARDGGPVIAVPDHPVFDADNHYYEALDAFTRHLDPAWGPRSVQWAEIDGRQYHVLGGRVSRAVVNPTFDPVAEPGVLRDYFRGNPNGDEPARAAQGPRPHPPRVPRPRRAPGGSWTTTGWRQVLDVPHARHGLRGAAQARPRGGDASCSGPSTAGSRRTGASPTADRIFAAPVPHARRRRLGDRRAGVGARPGRAHRRDAAGRADHPEWAQPPTDPAFDPFWARVNEAGITVVVHAGDSGYTSHGYATDGFTRQLHRRRPPAHQDAPARAADRGLPGLAHRGQALPPVPQPAGRLGRERRRGSCAGCSTASTRSATRCRAGSPRTRSRRSAATSGSTRSGRTTSTSCWS